MGGATNNHLKKLETVHKWVIEIIWVKSYQYPSDELYKVSQLLDIRQLYYMALSRYQRQNISNASLNIHNHNTRIRGKLLKYPPMTKTIGQRSFQFLAPRVYNTIPNEIKQLKTHKSFANKLRRSILLRSRAEIHQIADVKNS
ncbi:hypothetical protein WA026_020252 [Henosepilachna vigintioctopunctata]|uniref:Uncharacterized protein n=1 Tax=Henosepilachna vigintioctopunctata TaxID=420089 RepID=A0AAW1TPY9_9CUCU